MAKYKVEYDREKDKVTKTLTFMGKEYSEVWTNRNSSCKQGLETSVEKDHKDLPENVAEAVEDITYADDGDIMKCLDTLSYYEQSHK